MSQTFTELEIAESESIVGRWMVVLYNDEVHTLDEVITILMLATACDVDEAAIETWEAHNFGKAPVHFATKEECEGAAAVISSIGLKTTVSREWED